MIGKTIQQKRKEQGLTQAQVAEKLGVSAPAVNRWEKDLSYPDTTLLAPLARLLGIDMNELFSFHDSLTEEEREEITRKISNLLLDNKAEEAEELIEKVTKENPTDWKLFKEMALRYMIDANTEIIVHPETHIFWDKVIYFCKKVIELAPQETDSVIRHLVQAYAHTGQREKAELAWQKIPDTAKDKDRQYVNMLWTLKDSQEATNRLKKITLDNAFELCNNLEDLEKILNDLGDKALAEEAKALTKKVEHIFGLWNGLRKIKDKLTPELSDSEAIEAFTSFLDDTQKEELVSSRLFEGVEIPCGGREYPAASGRKLLLELLQGEGRDLIKNLVMQNPKE